MLIKLDVLCKEKTGLKLASVWEMFVVLRQIVSIWTHKMCDTVIINLTNGKMHCDIGSEFGQLLVTWRVKSNHWHPIVLIFSCTSQN